MRTSDELMKRLERQALRLAEWREANKPMKHHNATHGQSKTPEYRAYIRARERCENPRNDSFSRYSGHGIHFRFSSFPEFLAEVGKRPSTEHQLERINNERHYEPGNVTWATPKEQSRNTRTNRLVTYEGETQPLCVWIERFNLNHRRTTERLSAGWCIECALKPGVRQRCNHVTEKQPWKKEKK